MCDCVRVLNKNLEEAGENTMIDLPITFDFDGNLQAGEPMLVTKKRDPSKRGKMLVISCGHCPICGKSYFEQEDDKEITGEPI